MGKQKREERRPFAIQQLFMHKAKPWKKCSLAKSDSALNTIVRRLKCANASKLFNRESSDSTPKRSNSAPKFPFLTRNLEVSFNAWSSFEQKCRDYASQKRKAKEEESNNVEEEPDHAEPIVEFPPDDGDDNHLTNNENIPANNPTSTQLSQPTVSGLTRWKNTMELMPSPILPNQRNKHCLNDCSFETVQSLPTDSPANKFRRRKPARSMEQKMEPASSTTAFMDRSAESCLPSTPSFMREWKAKSRRRQLHSTPKNAFS